MGRAGVLRAVYQVLEASAGLRERLGHTQGATSVQAGARILGDSVFLEGVEDKLPLVILRVPSTGQYRSGLRNSTCTVEVFGRDAFEVAEVLDLLEGACEAYRMSAFPGLPVVLNNLQAGDDAPLDTGDPTIRIPAAQLALEVAWSTR